MLASYVLLDLETTGGTPLRDRITEIALIRYEGQVEVARWQTLVNPETSIPGCQTAWNTFQIWGGNSVE